MTEHTEGHATTAHLLMNTPFYRGVKIPMLEQPIGQGLNSTKLTVQLDVCIQD